MSQRLLARTEFKPATTLNLLAAAWIQFQVHDWFDHGDNESERPFAIPLESGRPSAFVPHENQADTLRSVREQSRKTVPAFRPPISTGRRIGGMLRPSMALNRHHRAIFAPVKAANCGCRNRRLPFDPANKSCVYRIFAKLVDRAGNPAHPFCTRTQCDLRSAPARISALGRRAAVSDR